MSEQLQTWTERRRDQARIDALEAELHAARKHNDTLASAYKDALDALADAHWHLRAGLWHHALWALVGAMAAVVAMRWLA